MHEFFSHSIELAELRTLWEKMSILHIRIPSQKDRYEEENQQIESYRNQVIETRLQLENLEKKRDHNEEQCNEIQEKIGHLQLEAESIEAEYRQVSQEVKKISAERERIQIQLRQLNERIEEIKKEIESVNEEIKQLDFIIHKDAPHPEYKTDGLYCENGIYMCTNHPPRQILVNGAEIAAHKKAVAEAVTRKNQLIIERNYLCGKRD